MYVLKNALKSITRNKLRNILIGIIVLIISISACVSLSIREAAEAAKEDTLSDLQVTGTISFNRQKAMEEMKKSSSSSSGSKSSSSSTKTDRSKFDFDVLQGSSLSLSDYKKYAKALKSGDSYYYSGAVSLNATGKILPYGTSEDDDSSSSSTNSKSNSNSGNMQPPGDNNNNNNNNSNTQNNQGGMGHQPFQVNQGDFSITGYSSYKAMLSMFGDDGSYKITKGKMFDETSNALECIISNELATYNSLKVGDTIKLANPNYEKETYKLKIVGIYKNSDSSSEENNRFQMNDPANNIYMNYNAFTKIIKASAKANHKMTDSDGNKTSAKLTENLAFTYTFKSVDNYNSFAKKVYKLGLSDDYTVNSNDLQQYENSLLPLQTLSQTAIWFFIIVLAVGGVILITLNIFNLRERKYEVGVLTAIGMKKAKVALQFVTEIFIVTFIALIIGTSVGAAVSVPVTNTLLANQIQSSQSTGNNVKENFGFKNDDNNGTPPDNNGGPMGKMFGQSKAQNYVDSVNSATNLFVVMELVLVGLFLTIIASLAALISIMRYEPLKILSNRS